MTQRTSFGKSATDGCNIGTATLPLFDSDNVFKAAKQLSGLFVSILSVPKEKTTFPGPTKRMFVADVNDKKDEAAHSTRSLQLVSVDGTSHCLVHVTNIGAADPDCTIGEEPF